MSIPIRDQVGSIYLSKPASVNLKIMEANEV